MFHIQIQLDTHLSLVVFEKLVSQSVSVFHALRGMDSLSKLPKFEIRRVVLKRFVIAMNIIIFSKKNT